MNIDPAQWKLFEQAYQIGQQVADMVKNHKADAALLGLLAATAMLRRKTSFTIDDVLQRMRSIDSVIDLLKMMTPQKAPTDG